MQDAENKPKRSRIRSKVQSPTSKPAFSLDKEKENNSSIRVAMADEKKEKNIASFSVATNHRHFVKDPFSAIGVKEEPQTASNEDKFVGNMGITNDEFLDFDTTPYSNNNYTSQSNNNSFYNTLQNDNDSPYSNRNHKYNNEYNTKVQPSWERKSKYQNKPAFANRFASTQTSTPNNRLPNKEKYPESLEGRETHNTAQKKQSRGYNLNADNPKHKASVKNSDRVGRNSQKNKSTKTYIQPAAEYVPRFPEEKAGSSEPIRLNKFLANSGICSRRNADLLIASGKIKVNGEVVTTMGTEITRQDIVEYNGKRVEIESRIYVLLNKPKNCMTTSDDPDGRMTVMDLVKNACKERIYPVGRLDRNTTGVLLLTNDGDMMAKLLHPSFLKKKIYQVTLDRPVEVAHMQQIAQGIELSDGEIHADAISYVKEDDFSVVGIEIHNGRNHIVRRIFEHFGYKIYKLDRVYFAGLTKKNLPRGRWRYLTEEEVIRLRMGNYE